MSKSRNRLFISDLQIPFEHERALQFCKYLKKTFSVADDDVYCVGDELDQWWGSMFDKDGEFEHTPNQEIDEARSKLTDWYIAFPKLKICESNHGIRWKKKAMHAQIPLQLMKSMQDVFRMPPGWLYQKRWDIDDKTPMTMVHGDDWGGQYPYMQAAMHLVRNTIIGHHHSKAGIGWIKTEGFNVWGMATGSLINFETYAFHYGRNHKFKPMIGSGVVLDNGKSPCWIELE